MIHSNNKIKMIKNICKKILILKYIQGCFSSQARRKTAPKFDKK